MKSVQIKTLELQNYRQFLDQKIDFSMKGDKNIIVLEGKNGFGKSNIFNAVTWCFFGTEEHLKPDERSLPICNSKKFQQLKQGSSLETSVKITIETESGQKIIERTLSIEKTAAGRVSTGKSEIKVSELVNKNWIISPYPQYTISRILPQDMRHFFFIDGEKLRQLFEKSNPEDIKKSIFDLSQITLLQNAIEHLSSYKSSVRGQTEGDSPEVDKLKGHLDVIEKQIKEEEKQLEENKKARRVAITNKEKLDKQLEGIDHKDLNRLIERISFLEEDTKRLEFAKVEKTAEYLKYLIGVSPKIFLREPIKKTIDIINKLKKADKLPPKIEAPFVEELLKSKKCICGLDLKKKENEKHKKKLEELIKDKVEYSGIVQEAIELRFSLIGCQNDEKEFGDKAKDFEKKIKEIVDELDQKQKALKETKEKRGNIDQEKVKKIHKQIESIESDIRQSDSKIGQIEANISHIKDNYVAVDSMYKKALKKSDKNKDILKRVNVCEEGVARLQEIKEKIMHEIREEIEKNTKKYFDNLITAKNFNNFEIDPEYKLIIEQDGLNAITSLSAAETLCMGYSFMAALRRSSKFLAPIIIDTPLAKIDKEYRINVAEWFIKSLKGAQVILLVTNSEYTSDFRKAIKSAVDKEYMLKHDSKSKITEVNKYGS